MVSPLVDFILTVAKVNQDTCQAVLSSGFLDVLLCMYACNFTSSICSVDVVKGGQISIIEAVCDALVILCRHPDALAVISVHPICVLWMLGCQTQERQMIWRELGPAIVTRRIASLATPVAMKVLNETELTDARADLVEFSR
jgi:hypothetical protein